MKNPKNTPVVTAKTLAAAHKFYLSGIRRVDISRLMGLSVSTLGRIHKSDFEIETYLENLQKINTKARKVYARKHPRIIPLTTVKVPEVPTEREIAEALYPEVARHDELHANTLVLQNMCTVMMEIRDILERMEHKKSGIFR